jgi:hypothetical protein
MTPIDRTLNILSIVVAALGGAWVGSSKCHVAVEIDSNEDRKWTWLDRICPCRPHLQKASWRQPSMQSVKSEP